MLGLMDKIMYKGRKFIPDWTFIHRRSYTFFRVTKQYHLPDTGYDLKTGNAYFFRFYDDVQTDVPSNIEIELRGGYGALETENFANDSDVLEMQRIKINRCIDSNNGFVTDNYYQPKKFSSKEESLYDYVRDILNGGVIRASLTHFFQCFKTPLTEGSVLNA